MADYFIIAAGGTGAMCVRSSVYMAAAGCADNTASYHVLLVDKDKDSDAQAACENLLADYWAMRKQLGQKADTYTLPYIKLHKWNFTEQIISEYEDQTGKSALNLQTLTLNKILNPNQDAKVSLLLETMYTQDELDTDLDKGFYGHPNIGAPVFQYVHKRFISPQYVDKKGRTVNNEFMTQLVNSLRKGNTYIYLFGSLFGGTGATVIPNVVLALRELWDTSSNRCIGDNAIIGATMAMPYFRLPACMEDSKDKLKALSPADSKFEDQTKEALAYYHDSRLLDNMMNLMLVGGTQLDVTSEIFARGGHQTQHFHLVLMLAAVTANRFFAGKLGGMNGIHAGSTEKITPLGELLFWKCAPNDLAGDGIYDTLLPAELDLSEEYQKMAAFLRFSVVVAYYMQLKFQKNWEALANEVEVLGTIRQMADEDTGRKPNPSQITQNDISVFYKKPVESAYAICSGFIRYLYDVSLSGYDWSRYHVYIPTGEIVNPQDGKRYYDYTLGPVSETAADGFKTRWTDFSNLTALKELLEADNPKSIIDNLTLNGISTYKIRNEDRGTITESDFPDSIATIYENTMLHDLRLERSWFGKGVKRTDVYFCEIYDKLMKLCM